jgi:hypothetical protein
MGTGFRIPALAIHLNEGVANPVPERVQLLKCGTYFHAQYGTFEISPPDLLSMKKNFDDRVRKIDLAIDYKHDNDDIAAGWIKSLDLGRGGTELWAEVKWTPNGTRVLADREFRYLSAEFDFNYQDNESLKEFGPTLLGAGLTNRPVVKGMTPAVELTEGKKEGDSKMKTVEQLSEENKKLSEQVKTLSDQVVQMKKDAEDKKDGGADDDQEDEMGNLKKQLADMQAKLDEANKKCADYETQMGELNKNKQLSEKKSRFDKMLSEGKAVEAQRDAYMKGDTDKFMELAQPVKLKAVGSGEGAGSGSGSDSDDPAAEIKKLAEGFVKEKKVKSLSEGIIMARRENPELRKRYDDKYSA